MGLVLRGLSRVSMSQNVMAPEFDRSKRCLKEDKRVSRSWVRVQRASDKHSRKILIDYIARLPRRGTRSDI